MAVEGSSPACPSATWRSPTATCFREALDCDGCAGGAPELLTPPVLSSGTLFVVTLLCEVQGKVDRADNVGKEKKTGMRRRGRGQDHV